MFIPLTKDNTFWDESETLLFIEDIFWMSKEASVLRKYSYKIFDVDFDELGVNELEMWRFAIQLAEAAGKILNQYHQVSFSTKYWQRVLFVWLRNFVPLVSLRFSRLQTLRQKYPQEPFKTLLADESVWTSPLLNAEELETMEGETADRYGWHLYSCMIRCNPWDIRGKTGESAPFYRKDQRLKREETPARKGPLFETLRGKIKRGVMWAVKKLLQGNLSPARVTVVLSAFGNVRLAFKLYIKTFGKVAWFPGKQATWIQKVQARPCIAWQFRQEAAAKLQSCMGGQTGYKQSLIRLFFQEIPCSFVENFKAVREVYRWQYEKFPHLKYIVNSAGALFTEHKMAMAEQGERGVQYAFVIHGGGRPSKPFQLRWGNVFSDMFYAWGTMVQDIDRAVMNCREAPAEKLYLYDAIAANQTKDILYVGDWVNAVLCHMGYHTMGRILQRETLFLQTLGKEIQNDVVMRNYPLPSARFIDRRLKDVFPQLRLSYEQEGTAFQNTTFAQILVNSRLCVVDHYETPFVEALYANKPVILYCDKDFVEHYFDLNTERTYVTMMEEVGILQYGPEAAANYLREIYPEIETWWREPRRQEVVRLLQERYTGRRMDAGNWWCQEILGLVKGEIQW